MTLLRAYAAFNFPLTPDEAYYWTWSLHPSFGYTDHPPMVAWLIALGSVLGHAYGAVRLPFVIAEAVAALAVGMAAKILAGDTRAGAYAAIAFTLIPQTKLEFGESIPDGAYVLAWSLALWAAAALARRVSPRAIAALGVALAATVYSRTFGWALVLGIIAWALTSRRDLLRPVAAACAIVVVLYIPYLLWNVSVGWETFAFEFVHRQSVNSISIAKLFDFGTVRFMLYGGILIVLTWFVALRRPPKLWLVVWTALPLPVALFALSFAMRTESYWIVGPAASLSIGLGVVLARTTARWRTASLSVLGIAAAYSTAVAVFLALPEGVQAAGFHAWPALRDQISSGVYAYGPMADDLRAGAAAGVMVYTDRYETSAELLWYGIPSEMVANTPQVPQWKRWYRPAQAPQRADLVIPLTPFGDTVGLEQNIRAAYAHVGTPKILNFRYAGEPEGTFYVTRLEGPRPNAQTILPGL
jgi:4-amino-4-deoxy-L-arabinose transferase-like glycosyltransferase